jgi:hypothetical protein
MVTIFIRGINMWQEDFIEIIKDDVKAYQERFDEEVWRKRWTERNYPINIWSYVSKFCPMEQYVKLFPNDLRSPVNLKEAQLFKSMRHNLKDFYINLPNEFIPVIRIKNYKNLERALNSLITKKYISVDRNYMSDNLKPFKYSGIEKMKATYKLYDNNMKIIPVTKKDWNKFFKNLSNEEKLKGVKNEKTY